ncbi:galactocerebrosidase-like [Liolophura sinensis]|uniref:galactocerebrosidase-like n=1 Tax=Liolophura sinensis TaxID=3198878 RepID=UPI003158F68C
MRIFNNMFGVFLVLTTIMYCSTHATDYHIDDSDGYGRTFDGIGGISGGGATSRLLVNYPQQQLGEILDYLFKPDYGASLQILKVEIGGDSESSDGTEASHMHNSWDENYNRGYEWWLMVEAKKRNPNILLYGLPWSFPGWVGQGTDSPYTNVTITADYIVRWIKGAKTHYNLTIDYIGIWNEKDYNVDYIKTLRKMLDINGFNQIRIVASDNKWAIADDIVKHPDLSDVVDVIGVHYPGTVSTSAAVQTGKQLWASEDYSTFNDNTGAGCWARILNQNYVNGQMTATIAWNLITAYYDGLSYKRNGLMTAMQPWSGHYLVASPIWATAHTTQFTQPGWKYLKHGLGVGKLDKGGSFVAMSNKGMELTVVIETLSHDHSICIRPFLPKYSVKNQNATFVLKGSFSKVTSLAMWYTKLGFNGTPSVFFKQMSPVSVINGTVTLELGIDEVFTLTTLKVGGHGNAPTPPPYQPFPLPYDENFEGYPENGEPNNFAQQVGSFEVVKSSDANRSKVLRQVVLEDPIDWCPHINLAFPLNVIGSVEWRDVHVEVEARTGEVNGSESVFVANRVDQGGCQTFGAQGYFFFVFPEVQKYELTNDLSRTRLLKSGSVSVNADWNKLGLSTTVEGQVTGFLNGNLVFNVSTSNKPKAGFSAIGAGSFGISDFDNFKISRTSQHVEGKGIRRDDTLYFKSFKGPAG